MIVKLIERTLVGQMLRYQAGRQMQCPSCEEILDGGRAVSIDLIRGNEIAGTRMVCAACADAGALRRAYQAGRRKAKDFRIQAIDGRLLDADDIYHPPGQTYRVGPRGTFTTRTQKGALAVRGISVTLMHPEHAAHERWFAYAVPAAADVDAHVRTWCFVHEATGFSAGRGGSLKGCIHTGLSRLLRIQNS